MSATTIPKGSLVLVTGANGYLGLHVADQFLEAGYKVRGTVRDEDKASWTKEYFDGKYGVGNYEAVVVKDIAAEGAFEKIVKGISGIAHVASDTTFNNDPNKVITPVLTAMNNILEASAFEPSVKSFVYTSSSAAVSATHLGVEYHLDASVWNEESVKNAWAPPPYEPSRAIDVYMASKTQAEQAAWKLLENAPASFKFNSVNPNLLVGKLLHPKQGKSSGGWLLALRDNDPAGYAALQYISAQWEVDVVDVAKLHVIALVDPEFKNERLLAYNEKVDFNIVVERTKAILGEEKTKHLEFGPEIEKNLGTVDTKRAVEALQSVGLPGFKSFDESLKEAFDLA